MDWLGILDAYLPPLWMTALRRIPSAQMAMVQEIRLRVGQPVLLSVPMGDRYLSVSGMCGLMQRGLLICSQEQLDACFWRFCDESVYAHEEELRQGFLSVAGGIRVGVAGTAVGGLAVRTVRRVTSLCIRLPRLHKGCAAPLMSYIDGGDRLYSTVLVGAPSSGKTTLLRDAAVMLASRGWRIAVVDERGEIAGVDGLCGCDVLSRYPKPHGIRQAIRTLAPQAVVFDELGDAREIEAVTACAHAGVAVISSMHAEDPDTLSRRASTRMMVRSGLFDRWIFLAGRHTPGVCVGAYRAEVTGDAIRWDAVDCGGGDRCRDALCASAASTHRVFAAHDAADTDDGTADELCGTAADADVAWLCRR